MMRRWIAVFDHLKVHEARKRLQWATVARARTRSTESEVATFAFLSALSLTAAFGFMSGIAPSRDVDDQLFSLALSLACLWNFFLFFCRFDHFVAILGDVDRIDRLREIVREGPAAGQFLQMQWRGQRPAND